MRDSQPADVDLVICSASHHQRPYPAIAIEIQNELGTVGAGFDMQSSSAAAGTHVPILARAGAHKRAPVMPGDDFGRHHQHPLVSSGAHKIDRNMQARGSRRAAEPHVEARTNGAKLVLYLDGDCRIWPLVMRGRADHQIDLSRLQSRMGKRLLCRGNGELGFQRQRVVRARGYSWRHAGGIEDTLAFNNVPVLNARRIDDEVIVGFRQRVEPRSRPARIFAVHPAVETFNQFLVGDRGLGNFSANAADDDAIYAA